MGRSREIRGRSREIEGETTLVIKLARSAWRVRVARSECVRGGSQRTLATARGADLRLRQRCSFKVSCIRCSAALSAEMTPSVMAPPVMFEKKTLVIVGQPSGVRDALPGMFPSNSSTVMAVPVSCPAAVPASLMPEKLTPDTTPPRPYLQSASAC